MRITTNDIERLLYEYEGDCLRRRGQGFSARLEAIVAIRIRLREAVSAGGFPWSLSAAKAPDNPNVGKICRYCGKPILPGDHVSVSEFEPHAPAHQ